MIQNSKKVKPKYLHHHRHPISNNHHHHKRSQRQPYIMPSDLIKKSQKTLRKQAKLSPPPQPPSLSSIEDSISDLNNPSPSNTLCRQCKLKLLRGSNSMICIYCGACQAGDHISLKPIGFHSTSGYRSLLKSLELNPEDRIGAFFDENRRNKSGTPVEEGISLAELLDVKIEWRDDPEKHETGSVKKTFDHISFLNISNFATGSGRDNGSDVSEEEEEEEEEEQSVSGENDPSDAYEDQENLSLFENDAPIETASISSAESRHDEDVQSVTSGIYNDGNSLSEDDADVENENSGTQNEESETIPQPFDFRSDSSSGRDADATQNEDAKTSLSRGSSGDDMEVQSLNSKRQDEDSEAVEVSSDVRDDSSPRPDADLEFVNSKGQENEDSETNDAISSYMKKGSLSEDDTDLQSVIKTAALSSDLRASSLSRHDSDVQSVNSSIQENEDINTKDDISSDLNRKSSSGCDLDLRDDSPSGRDPDIQLVNLRSQENDDSNTNPSISSDVRRDSLSGDDETEIETVNSRVPHEDSEITDLSSDIRVDSLPRRNAENDDIKANVAISSDLNKDSSSGDDTEVQSAKSRTRDEDSKTAALPSDSSSDSLSRHDAESQSVKARPQENEDIAITAATSTDLKKDPVSGDDTEIQSLGSRSQNEDPTTSDLRANSLSRSDSESEPVNLGTQNEEPKTNFVSRDDIETQNVDSKISDVSRDEMEVYSVETRTRNEDAETADISSDLRIESSSRHDAELESVNSGTQENEDTETAAMSYDFKRDSSQDNKDSSGDGSFRHDAFQRVNSRVHDEDSKTNAAESSNLNRESSFEDDSEIPAVKSRMQNDDSETADVSSDLRSHSSFRNDAEPQSEADLSSNYSYGNGADIQSSHFKNQNGDCKTTAAVSPDTRKDNSFEDDTGIQSEKYRLQNDNSDAATAISSELDSDIQHVESETAASPPNLSGNSSFDDNAEIQHVNLMTKNEDSETTDVLSVESSSQDETKVQSFHSNVQNDDIETANASPYIRSESSSRAVTETQHNEDSKSEVHMDSVSGYIEDANKDNPNNNLDPIDKD